MTTIIRSHRVDETHVVVLREDVTLTGELLGRMVLLRYGHWRAVKDAEPYPDESYLTIE